MGLIIIFGLMNVINMAHGEFFLLGAYTVVLVQSPGGGFWFALLAAPLVLALIGLVLEELVIRHVYHRFIDTILATWGSRSRSSRRSWCSARRRSRSRTRFRAGSRSGAAHPTYRLFIMAVAIIVVAGRSLCSTAPESGSPLAVIANGPWRRAWASTPAHGPGDLRLRRSACLFRGRGHGTPDERRSADGVGWCRHSCRSWSAAPAACRARCSALR